MIPYTVASPVPLLTLAQDAVKGDNALHGLNDGKVPARFPVRLPAGGERAAL
jgi:hypothetical protein